MVGGHYVRTLEHQCLEFPGKYQTPGFASDGHIVEVEIREALQVNVGLVADDDPVRLQPLEPRGAWAGRKADTFR